jgi:hypothetical protein
MAVDPNNTTLYLELGGDLVISPSGGILMATGWDQVRQRIMRRLFTNPELKLADGEVIPADYIFDKDYGIGINQLIDELITSTFLSNLTSRIKQGVMTDEGVDSTKDPLIEYFALNQGIYVQITVTLTTGIQGQLVFEIQR